MISIHHNITTKSLSRRILCGSLLVVGAGGSGWFPLLVIRLLRLSLLPRVFVLPRWCVSIAAIGASGGTGVEISTI